jgi:cytochrome c553
MARHAADVDRLWVALIRPSEAELEAAVQAIERAAGSPRATGIDLRVLTLARELRRAAPADRPAVYGALLAACADCHTTGRSLSVPQVDGVPLPDLSVAMAGHYTSALALQLAVIGDDAAWIRRSAGELATLEADADLPAAAAPFVADLRAAGERALAATTPADAARAAGDVLLACGACHVASGAGPRDPLPPPPTEPHMAIHLYGAYWLAYGVYAPDERAWRAGAEALTSASLGEGTTPAEVDAEQAVHALGARAFATTGPAARAALWGELATTCAGCHRRRVAP